MCSSPALGHRCLTKRGRDEGVRAAKRATREPRGRGEGKRRHKIDTTSPVKATHKREEEEEAKEEGETGKGSPIIDPKWRQISSPTSLFCRLRWKWRKRRTQSTIGRAPSFLHGVVIRAPRARRGRQGKSGGWCHQQHNCSMIAPR